MKRVAALDCETSAMKAQGGQIIEFAMVLADKDLFLPIQKHPEFLVYVKLEPGAYWDPDAERTHGITREFLEKHGVPKAQAIRLLLDFLHFHNIDTWDNQPKWWNNAHHTTRSQLIPLGHNLTFDLSFLKMWFGPGGMELFTYKVLDTMHSAAIIQGAHKQAFGYNDQPFRDPEEGFPSVSLSSVASAFGLDIEGAHGALTDCYLALESWRLMIHVLAGDLRNSRDWEDLQDRQRKEAIQNINFGTYEKPIVDFSKRLQNRQAQ